MISAQEALKILYEGNHRFVSGVSNSNVLTNQAVDFLNVHFWLKADIQNLSILLSRPFSELTICNVVVLT